MAKKAKVETTSGSIFDIINSVDNGCELIEDSAGAQITEYIELRLYQFSPIMACKRAPAAKVRVFILRGESCRAASLPFSVKPSTEL